MKKWLKILIIVVAVIVGISAFLYFYPPMPLYIYRTENIVDEYFAAFSDAGGSLSYFLQGDDTKIAEVLRRMNKCIRKLNHIHPPAGAKLDYEQLKKALELSSMVVISRLMGDEEYVYNAIVNRSINAWRDWELTRKNLKQ